MPGGISRLGERSNRPEKRSKLKWKYAVTSTSQSQTTRIKQMVLEDGQLLRLRSRQVRSVEAVGGVDVEVLCQKVGQVEMSEEDVRR